MKFQEPNRCNLLQELSREKQEELQKEMELKVVQNLTHVIYSRTPLKMETRRAIFKNLI